MTEEDKLKNAPGCGTLIMGGIIIIIILSLVGIIFPDDVLPYPTEILVAVLIVAVVALIVGIFMLRRKKKDDQDEMDNKADEILRTGLKTMGDADDEASKLAQQYNDEGGTE